MQKFEYSLEGWLEDYDVEFEEWLNILGNDGWQLIQSFSDPATSKSVHCIFKRASPIVSVSVCNCKVKEPVTFTEHSKIIVKCINCGKYIANKL